MSKIHRIGPAGSHVPAPKPFSRPAQCGLSATVTDLEWQLGTVEAYNELCRAASELRGRIDEGDVVQGAPMASERSWMRPTIGRYLLRGPKSDA